MDGNLLFKTILGFGVRSFVSTVNYNSIVSSCFPGTSAAAAVADAFRASKERGLEITGKLREAARQLLKHGLLQRSETNGIT